MACYYGWPVIEAIIILLPIPDPKDIIAKIKSFVSGQIQAVSKKASGPSVAKKGPYARDFDQAPDTLGESDEEGEDDIGKVPKLQPRNTGKKSSGLSYGDSDDDEERDQTQLITLDGASIS